MLTGGVITAVRIDDAHDRELGIIRHGQLDSDQAFVEQQTIGLAPPVDGRCVDVMAAIRTIVGSEDRVEPLSQFESNFQFLCGNAPTLGRTVAGATTPSIRT